MLPRRAASLLALFLTVWVDHPAHALGSLDRTFLDNPLIRHRPVQSVLEHKPIRDTTCKTPPTGPIETTLCNYELIESNNGKLHSHLQQLVKLPYFKYFRTDLYRGCPFWQGDWSCSSRECGITSIDESEIPEKWRAAALSRLIKPSPDLNTDLPGCYYRDTDFCFLDDTSGDGEYYDLSTVPERFTGYSGPSAHQIWSSIYRENCFGLSELNLMTSKSPAPVSLPDTLSDVMRSNGHDAESPEQCLEKRVYYKVISGLHASISTHICMDYLINPTTGEWGPNLQCFIDRVATHPERLQYIYFNTVLLLRAVARIGPYLSSYDYCSCASSQHDVDDVTLNHLKSVIGIAQDIGKFDETVLFRGENANVLKNEFKSHFRNVSRIMDCVECDKCRLWGKVQTTGVATALKILFELDEKALDAKANPNLLTRAEIVALINTLNRFSESLVAVDDFRRMWAEMDAKETEKLLPETLKPASQVVKKSHQTSAASPIATNIPPQNARPHPIPDTKSRVSQPEKPSPSAGAIPPLIVLEDIRRRLQFLVSSCEQGASNCLGALAELWTRVLKALQSFLAPLPSETRPEL